MGDGGGAVRARCARRQSLPVRPALGDRAPRRAPSPGAAVVRRRLPVHGRHGSIARAAHGLRPLHGRMVHLLRADRARRWGAHGTDSAHPRTHGCRRRTDRRVGAAVRRGRCRDRGCVARRVEATGRGEHGAGAHDALHTAVRGDAGRRRRRLRRHQAWRRVRSRTPQHLRRPAAGRPLARPVRDVRAGPVHVAGLVAGAALLSARFLTRRSRLHRLERWQTTYLPVFALWAATVVVILPPLFAFD